PAGGIGERHAQRRSLSPEGGAHRPETGRFRALPGRRLQGLYRYVEAPGWGTVKDYNGPASKARAARQPTPRRSSRRRWPAYRGATQEGARGAEGLPGEDRLGPRPAQLRQRRPADRIPLAAVRRAVDHADPARHRVRRAEARAGAHREEVRGDPGQEDGELAGARHGGSDERLSPGRHLLHDDSPTLAAGR